jgi:hypothetical protein|tara:strand:+ start:507 stop:923 length:417 start_codon:yes stop_codon:yes gene_type:complete
MDNIVKIAFKIKTAMEMLIATVAFGAILASLLNIHLGVGGESISPLLENMHPLKTAAFALAIAASFDLLFLLFSPGMKEGMNALMLGFTAAILMTISEEVVVGWEIAVTVLVFTFCLLAIWIISERFTTAESKEYLDY